MDHIGYALIALAALLLAERLYRAARYLHWGFWGAIKRHPESFLSQARGSDAWYVCNNKYDIPQGDEWAGPFHLSVPPFKKTVKFYGKDPDYRAFQEEFMLTFRRHKLKMKIKEWQPRCKIKISREDHALFKQAKNLPNLFYVSTKNNKAWRVCMDQYDYPEKPGWVGPFHMFVPCIRKNISLFGKIPDYKEVLQRVCAVADSEGFHRRL